MKEIAEKQQREAAQDLEAQYGGALREYLAEAGEGALRRAYEVGRQALGRGISVLEMTALHQRALAEVLRGADNPGGLVGMLDAAAEFLAESLSPYEMAHRGYREAIAALHHLNETLEQEVKRIAHAVHDEAGQLLVAVNLAVAEVARDVHPALRARLLEVTALLNRIEEQLRRLSHELRPTVLDDLGLVPALQFLAASVSKRTNLPIHVEATLDGRLSAKIETVLYRVIQEALANVVKHSRAKTVKIQLATGARVLSCSVQDDGVGFDVPAVVSQKGQKGLGLIGIQERLTAVGGTLRINSPPGQGTRLDITVPVED